MHACLWRESGAFLESEMHTVDIYANVGEKGCLAIYMDSQDKHSI